MPSYNEWDGEPCSGNRELLNDLLREELAFKGVTFSDVGALGMLVSPFRRVADDEHAAALALEAGVDFETAQNRLYQEPLLRAIELGFVSIETVDRSVKRVLELKFRLGLFEAHAILPPVNPAEEPDLLGDPQEGRGQSTTQFSRKSSGSETHRILARQVAREGIVLLKNEGILPLPRDLKRLAVIGPNADNIYNQLGDYTPPQRPNETITVLEGLRRILPSVDVAYARGCGIRDSGRAGFSEAMTVAESSDAVVLVLGGSSARDFTLDDLNTPAVGAMGIERTSSEIECGEGVDRCSLDLLGEQIELAQALLVRGKPLVVVLIGGRPMTIEWIRENVPAILFAGYPGQEGGRVIAEVLMGVTNPSGRLSMTWPRGVGQLPMVYNSKPGVGNGYLDGDSTPAFCFGHGLSYARFEYRGIASKVLLTPTVEVRVSVRNTSQVPGQEVVQLYLRDELSSLTRPVRELKGFQRIHLDPGEERLVTFPWDPRNWVSMIALGSSDWSRASSPPLWAEALRPPFRLPLTGRLIKSFLGMATTRPQVRLGSM